MIPNTPTNVTSCVLSRSQIETVEMATALLIKRGVHVMLTVNVDLSDRLVNEQLGSVEDVVIIKNIIKTVVTARSNFLDCTF